MTRHSPFDDARIDELEARVLTAQDEAALLAEVQDGLRSFAGADLMDLGLTWSVEYPDVTLDAASDPRFLHIATPRRPCRRQRDWLRLDRLCVRLLTRIASDKRALIATLLATPRWSGLESDLRQFLGRPLHPFDGMWPEELAAAEQRLGFKLPDALREYYLLVGRRYDLQEENHLTSPYAVSAHATPEMLCFLVENQGVVGWAVLARESNDPDPGVVELTEQPGPELLEYVPEFSSRPRVELASYLFWELALRCNHTVSRFLARMVERASAEGPERQARYAEEQASWQTEAHKEWVSGPEWDPFPDEDDEDDEINEISINEINEADLVDEVDAFDEVDEER